jgi:hypothetical protein
MRPVALVCVHTSTGAESPHLLCSSSLTEGWSRRSSVDSEYHHEGHISWAKEYTTRPVTLVRVCYTYSVFGIHARWNSHSIRGRVIT